MGDKVGVRSPNGDGSGSKVVEVAVAAAAEMRKLLVPFIAGPVESLLDWPSILSLLKREAIEERERRSRLWETKSKGKEKDVR